jgi:hypothetical protein
MELDLYMLGLEVGSGELSRQNFLHGNTGANLALFKAQGGDSRADTHFGWANNELMLLNDTYCRPQVERAKRTLSVL